jgi:hypothetical protein
VTQTDWLAGASASVRPGGRPAKDHRGRQRKMHCASCGFIAYASRGAIERCGMPVCGCGEPMVLANLRDRAQLEWDALERELSALGRDAYNDAMREIGARDLVIAPLARVSKGGLVQKRCEAHGCHKFAAARFCPTCAGGTVEMGRA